MEFSKLYYPRNMYHTYKGQELHSIIFLFYFGTCYLQHSDIVTLKAEIYVLELEGRLGPQ
jgi:hypothetical protein